MSVPRQIAWWVLACLAACAGVKPDVRPARGALLLIGGGLDNDNAPVYRRFLELASVAGEPRIVIATAATGPQDEEATDKAESLRTWAPGVAIEVVRRETSTGDAVAAIDRATAMFFTGGDQARVTARYRPEGGTTPELEAMRRLLARGGVIAGASAGCAMMGPQMLLGGRSAQALGVPGEDGESGPRLGAGMGFLPDLLTDSHFFERDRLGRLVAGAVAAGLRAGLGVGEDAAVEVDLATGMATGVSVSESLLVDATHLRRDGDRWLGLRARVLAQGDCVDLRAGLGAAPPPALDETAARDVPVVEPGQNRQLALWRLFRQAAATPGALRLRLAGHQVVAARDGAVVAFVLRTAP